MWHFACRWHSLLHHWRRSTWWLRIFNSRSPNIWRNIWPESWGDLCAVDATNLNNWKAIVLDIVARTTIYRDCHSHRRRNAGAGISWSWVYSQLCFLMFCDAECCILCLQKMGVCEIWWATIKLEEAGRSSRSDTNIFKTEQKKRRVRFTLLLLWTTKSY